MHRHIHKTISAIASAALLCAMSTGMAHAAYYAKTISGAAVYSLEAQTAGGVISSSVFWTGGTALGGIATHGDYAFVSDNNVTIKDLANSENDYTGPVLRVFHLGSGLIDSVKLRIGSVGVQSAGAVTVDGSGHVYVADTAQTTSSKFAVVQAPDWAHPNTDGSVSYGSVTGNWMIDIDSYNDGAVVLQRDDPVGGASASHLTGAVPAGPHSLLGGTNEPIAVTVDKDNNNTYFVSDLLTYEGQKTFTVMGRGFDWTTLGIDQTFSGTAHDIALVSDIESASLAVVGLYDFLDKDGKLIRKLGACKIGLTGGAPSASYLQTSLATDLSASHACAASPDGKMLWVTSQAGQTAYGLAFGDWVAGTLASQKIGLSDNILALATHEYVAPVPEPSSLLSLVAFGVGAFGFLRRRGR